MRVLRLGSMDLSTLNDEKNSSPVVMTVVMIVTSLMMMMMKKATDARNIVITSMLNTYHYRRRCRFYCLPRCQRRDEYLRRRHRLIDQGGVSSLSACNRVQPVASGPQMVDVIPMILERSEASLEVVGPPRAKARRLRGRNHIGVFFPSHRHIIGTFLVMILPPPL